jgi:hypothetical protein
MKTGVSKVKEGNIADAVTLGEKMAENSSFTVLNEAGKLALLETSILSNCKQLRFLEGRSGIATFLIFIQAIGYIISTGFRAIHHLPVSPIEAIGFAYSMFVVVHSVFHSLGAICYNPLVVYLNRTQEQQMLDKCQSTRWSKEDDIFCVNAAIVRMSVVGSVVVALTTLVQLQAYTTLHRFELGRGKFISFVMTFVGPIIFLVSLAIQLLLYILNMKCSGDSLAWRKYFIALFSIAGISGILYSIFFSIAIWSTNKFDSRTPSIIHILPFLG